MKTAIKALAWMAVVYWLIGAGVGIGMIYGIGLGLTFNYAWGLK